MALQVNPACPMCGGTVNGVFPVQCPYCPFNRTILATGGVTHWQRTKWSEHTDIIVGRNVQLYGKPYNASFDYNGATKLEDVLRFGITFGDRIILPSSRGPHTNPGIIAYIPETIGSGTSIYSPDLVPCSDLFLMSPHNLQWSHAFPVLDDWIRQYYGGRTSTCRVCGAQTGFAQPVCAQCYSANNGDWQSFL